MDEVSDITGDFRAWNRPFYALYLFLKSYRYYSSASSSASIETHELNAYLDFKCISTERRFQRYLFCGSGWELHTVTIIVVAALWSQMFYRTSSDFFSDTSNFSIPYAALMIVYFAPICLSLLYIIQLRKFYRIYDRNEYAKSESFNFAEISSKRKNYFSEVIDKDDGELSIVDEMYKDELNAHRFKNTAQGTIAEIDRLTNLIMWTCFGYSFSTIITSGGYAIYHNHFNSQSCDIIGCIDGSIIATTLLVQVTLPFFLSWTIPMSWRSILICECLSNLCILANIFSAKEYENEKLVNPKFIMGIIGVFGIIYMIKRCAFKRHIRMFLYSDLLYVASIREVRGYLYSKHSANRRREVDDDWWLNISQPIFKSGWVE